MQEFWQFSYIAIGSYGNLLFGVPAHPEWFEDALRSLGVKYFFPVFWDVEDRSRFGALFTKYGAYLVWPKNIKDAPVPVMSCRASLGSDIKVLAKMDGFGVLWEGVFFDTHFKFGAPVGLNQGKIGFSQSRR